MPVTRRQHKIPPARNNPYAAPPGQEIGEYRQHMMNIFNLYAYITLPDKQDNNYKRPVHQPFCNRNIFYLMDKQEKKKKGYSNNPHSSAIQTDELPTVMFTKVKHEFVNCAFVKVYSYVAKEVDGEFTELIQMQNAVFKAPFNADFKTFLDLVDMKPRLYGDSHSKNEYLILRVDFMAKEQPRKEKKLRTLESRHSPDESSKGKICVQSTMFGVKLITTMNEPKGHKIKRGKCAIALIASEELGIDVSNDDWMMDKGVVSKILMGTSSSADKAILSLQIMLWSDRDSLEDGSEDSQDSVKSEKPKPVREMTPEDSAGYLSDIWSIIPDDQREEMLKAPIPEVIGWVFKMTEEESTPPPVNVDSMATYQDLLKAAESAAPADVIRYSYKTCYICHYNRPFKHFGSFLCHLALCHGRMTFQFRKNALQLSDEIRKKVKENNPKFKSDKAPTITVSFNPHFDGSHESNLSKHYNVDGVVEEDEEEDFSVDNRKQKRPMKLEGNHQPLVFFNKLRVKAFRKIRRADNPIGEYMFDAIRHFPSFDGGRQFHTNRHINANPPYKLEHQFRELVKFVDLNEYEASYIALFTKFLGSFNKVYDPIIIYQLYRILIDEERDKLLAPKTATQFIIALCHQRKIKRLDENQIYDLIARLKFGPTYDPKKDAKHIVCHSLKQLEQTRLFPDTYRRRIHRQTSQASSEQSQLPSRKSSLSTPSEPGVLEEVPFVNVENNSLLEDSKIVGNQSLLAEQLKESSTDNPEESINTIVQPDRPPSPAEGSSQGTSPHPTSFQSQNRAFRYTFQPVSPSTLRRLASPNNEINDEIEINRAGSENNENMDIDGVIEPVLPDSINISTNNEPILPESLIFNTFDDLKARYNYEQHKKLLKYLWIFIKKWKRSDF